MGKGLLVGEGSMLFEYPGAVPFMVKPGTTPATEGSAIGYASEVEFPARVTGALRSQ